MPLSQAQRDSARAKHGPLVDHFSFYAAYHNNSLNQAIHIIGVPLILMTAFVFLNQVALPSTLPGPIGKAIALLPFPATWSVPIALAYAHYYLFLAPGLLGISAALMTMICLIASHAFPAVGGLTVVQTALTVHVACWLGQFWGHWYEGRKPALLDNLFQALFMAPFFVMLEVLMLLGLMSDFKAAVTPIVDDKIAELKAKDAKNAK